MLENNIEKFLAGIEPRKASANFKSELLGKIGDTALTVIRTQTWNGVVSLLAAAAAVAICSAAWFMVREKPAGQELMTAQSPSPAEHVGKKTPGMYEPSVASTLLVAYEKEPVMVAGESFSRHRYHLVDCMEWKDSKTGGRYSVVRPRQETIILCDNVY